MSHVFRVQNDSPAFESRIPTKGLVSASALFITAIALFILAATIQSLPPYGTGLLITTGVLCLVSALAILRCCKERAEDSPTSHRKAASEEEIPIDAAKPHDNRCAAFFVKGREFVENYLEDDIEVYGSTTLQLIVTVSMGGEKAQFKKTLGGDGKKLSLAESREKLNKYLSDSGTLVGAFSKLVDDTASFTLLSKTREDIFTIRHREYRFDEHFDKVVLSRPVDLFLEDPGPDKNFEADFANADLSLETAVDDNWNFV